MKINDCIRQSDNLTRLFRKQPVVLIMLIVLCATSCKSPKGLNQTASSDSLQSIRKFALTLMPVPASVATLEIPVQKLKTLPIGAGYNTKSGQATIDMRRVSDSTLIVTATCDSLARQVILLEEELTRIRSETSIKEKPAEVIHEPTGWQWFQIWTGRIAVIFCVLILIKRRFNKTKK